MDYKKKLEETMQGMGKLGENTPNQMKGFQELMGGIDGAKKLSSKTKELINVALAVKAQCKPCIAFHTSGALKAGAKKDEIMEAGWCAVLMGGGPALMYLIEVEKAIEDFNKK